VSQYYVYILRCAGDMLYTGVTTDPLRRLQEHRSGRKRGGARFTAARPPEGFADLWLAPDRSEAQKLESRIKAMTRPQKLALIRSESGPEGYVRQPLPEDPEKVGKNWINS